ARLGRRLRCQAVAPIPTGGHAGRYQENRRRSHALPLQGPGRAFALDAVRAQARGRRLVREMAIEGAERLVLPLPARHFLRGSGILGQIGLDRRAGMTVQRAVHIGVKLVFADLLHLAAHFTDLSLGASVSVSTRSAARARASRDIRVPTGMESAAAASA